MVLIRLSQCCITTLQCMESRNRSAIFTQITALDKTKINLFWLIYVAYSSRFEQRNHVILHESGAYALFGLLKQHYRSSERMQFCSAFWLGGSRTYFCQQSLNHFLESQECSTSIFPQDSPGIVMTHTSVDSSESPFQLLKKGIDATSFNADDLPQIRRPEGLSKDRVQYLKRRSNRLFDLSFEKFCSPL